LPASALEKPEPQNKPKMDRKQVILYRFYVHFVAFGFFGWCLGLASLSPTDADGARVGP
jgi:hypothetical protein